MWEVFPGTPAPTRSSWRRQHRLLKDQEGKLLIDSFVTHCGDDLELIMTHTHGVDNEKVHKLAWDVFMECTAIAKSMKLYGAGQDMLADAFSGNVKGMGPGCCRDGV